jgi:DNA-directed RNA polymerase specialized sigma subunit
MANYIDNKKFEELVIQYCSGDTSKEEELFGMFSLLIDNIISSFKFTIEPEDAKQECFILILKILKKYDKSKGNVFNFFTTSILNNLKHLYTKDKAYKLKLEAYFQRNLHLKDLLEP